MSAGYSGTPLIRKLGLKAGMKAVFLDPPTGYQEALGELPERVRVLRRLGRDVDFIHLFARDLRSLERRLPVVKRALALDGALWISWVKKNSPRYAGFGDADVRALGLAAGLVDVKVCAVDEDWSALKFVYRLEDRR
jgi:hypothetical protein